MPNVTDTLKRLEEKLEDLQRDTKFCVNNYDYHHQNNEHEILQKMQDILKESFQDGQDFFNNMNNVSKLIETANKKISKADEMLKALGEHTKKVHFSDSTGNCPASSHSFTEDDQKQCDDLLENKENKN